MTIEAYTNPDFGWPEKIIFFVAALLGLLVCDMLALFYAKLTGASRIEGGNKNRVQLFYEMIISGTSVMSFSCAYVIINHVYSLVLENGTGGNEGLKAFVDAWESGKDFILLLLICLSCVLNTLLDKFIIPLKGISKDEKATVRMLAMFYVIIILVHLNNIGDESEYTPVMMYYLGLMVGRFVYFDASLSDFVTAMKNVFKSLPLLILGLAFTGLLCWFGFNSGFLLERNYYIVGVFYTHLFMLAAVFLLHHTHILDLIFRERNPESSPSKSKKKTVSEKIPEADYDDEEYEDEEYAYEDEEYDDYEEYDEYDASDRDDPYGDYENNEDDYYDVK